MTTLVFYRSRGIVSRLIRWATRHQRPMLDLCDQLDDHRTYDAGVSHVAIVTDPTDPREVLSATTGGVRIDSERIWMERHDAEIVEEWQIPDIDDGVLIERARRLGERYDYTALLGHGLRLLLHSVGIRIGAVLPSHLTVCSELVVRCAQSSHHEALPLQLLGPETTIPEDLRRVMREAGYQRMR